MSRPKVIDEKANKVGSGTIRQNVTTGKYIIQFTGTPANVAQAKHIFYVYMVDGGLDQNIENHLINNGVNARITHSNSQLQNFDV